MTPMFSTKVDSFELFLDSLASFVVHELRKEEVEKGKTLTYDNRGSQLHHE